ncbi:MAG: hypothetical protein DBX59_10510 [Bacillota bacterium]|nr:MAG: hypothetical protein DBX59_10510 [Bacillota bacterium]
MIVTNVRKKNLVKQGVCFTCMKGRGEYNLIHFFNPATVLVDGEYVTTKENAVLIYGPHAPHAIDCNVGDLYFEKFSFTDDAAAELLEMYGLLTDKIYYPSDSCAEELHRLFDCIDDEFFRPRKFAGNAVRIYAEQIFLTLCRDVNSDSPEYNEKIVNTFCEIRKAIYSQPNKEWNVDDMAKAAKLNKARFFELYKKLFGISPIQDIISLRVRIAKTLLGTHKYTVAEVAEMTGYQNVFHFIRQFKKHTDITPKQFEKQN